MATNNTMKYAIAVLFTLCIVCSSVFANNEIPGAPQTKPIAIVGGKVFTVSHGIIENGTVVFDKGKIVAVGASVDIPKDAQVIDAKGKNVYPGMIAPNTTLGISEIDAVRATQDVSEVGLINPNVRGDIGYNPDSEIPPTVRTNGITTAEITPQGGFISGTSSLMDLDGWTREDMDVKASLGVHVYWPAMSISHGWWITQSDEEQQKSIEKNLDTLFKAFREAKEYWLAKKQDTTIPKDVRWEAMLPVFDGKEPLFVHASNLRQIRSAIDYCSKENLRMVLVGGTDAWRILPLVKDKNIPVVLDRVNALPARDEEDYDAGYSLPKKLYDAGIQFCFSEDGSWPQRNLPFQAATSIAFGVPEDAALRAVTLSTAEILGVADRLGSLDAGKDANIVISTGDLLDIQTNNVVQEFIQGRNVDLNNKQKDLYHKYEEKYSRYK
jgi:imidazolonepropionase-like amidohydrolase